MNRFAVTVTAIILLSVTGYAKLPKPENLEADSIYALGEGFYHTKDYRKAIRYLDFFVLNYPVKVEIVKAQYYLATSYYNIKAFQQASVEFEFLYKQFPNSEFAEEAHIRAAEATFEISEPYYKEQFLTLNAQRKAESFLETYPNSPFASDARQLLVRIDDKLALKELEAAKLYFKFKEYDAAVMSLEYILANFPRAHNTNAETRYYLGRCKAELDEIEEAQAILEELLDNPVWQKKAKKALDRIEKNQ